MKKQIVSTKVDYSLNWAYSVEISQIKKDLDAIEKLGATHVEIDSVTVYDDSYVKIEPVSEHLETDEEFELRVSEKKRKAEEIKKAELEQYEKIKTKYNL